MRKLILAFAAAASALAVAGPAGAATTTISIYGSTFTPKNVTVTQGDTVTWVNRDNDTHQVLATGGQFASAILKQGQKYSFTLQRPRDLQLQGRAAPEADREDHGQGCAADADPGGVAAVDRLRDEGDADRRRSRATRPVSR